MNRLLLKNGLFNTLGGGARIGLGILTIPLLIRLIGLNEFGLWTIANSAINILNLAEGGLIVSTAVFVSKDVATDRGEKLSQTLTATIGTIIVLSSIALISLYSLSGYIPSFFPLLQTQERITLSTCLQLGSVVIWARLLQNVLIGVEQGFQKYGLLNLINTIQAVLLNSGLLTIAMFGGHTIDLMLWYVIIGMMLLCVHAIVVWSLIKEFNIHVLLNKRKTFEIASYSIKTWIASIGGVVFNQVDRLIVGASLGTEALGIYAAITNIATQINTFSALPVQPLLPSLTSLVAQKYQTKKNMEKEISSGLYLNIYVAFSLGIFLFIIGEYVLRTVVNQNFSDGYIFAFNIAIFIYSLYSTSAVGFYMCLSSNAVSKVMFIQLSSGILTLLLITIGINHLGLLGAIFGNGGYLCVCLLTALGMKQYSISHRVWINWIKFPLQIFLIAFCANFLPYTSLSFNIIILIFCETLLTIWFFRKNPIIVKSILNKIGAI